MSDGNEWRWYLWEGKEAAPSLPPVKYFPHDKEELVQQNHTSVSLCHFMLTSNGFLHWVLCSSRPLITRERGFVNGNGKNGCRLSSLTKRYQLKPMHRSCRTSCRDRTCLCLRYGGRRRGEKKGCPALSCPKSNPDERRHSADTSVSRPKSCFSSYISEWQQCSNCLRTCELIGMQPLTLRRRTPNDKLKLMN